jgi:cytochrome P450
VTVYDPFDEASLADPYDTYRALRDHDPVHRHEDPDFYALSRFEDVWEAVRDPGLFSSARGLTFHPDEIGTLGLPPTIVMLDPPRQTELRRLVSHGFTPRRIAALEDDLRRFVRGRIMHMESLAADGAPVDLHRDFSAPLPTYALANLLGVPEADRARFGPWVKALTTVQDEGFDARAITDAPEAVAEMFGYFGDLITARRAAPGDDLVSALVDAEVDGDRLSDWDILGFCFVMVAGGNDTTANLVSHGVMRPPGQAAGAGGLRGAARPPARHRRRRRGRTSGARPVHPGVGEPAGDRRRPGQPQLSART